MTEHDYLSELERNRSKIMTSDIAQRLRAVAGERYSEGANKGGTAGLLEDAANEIDRLCARLDELEGQEPMVPDGYALIPLDPRYTARPKANVTNEMKAENISQYTFTRDTVDEDGNDADEEIMVPWNAVKEIYQGMAKTAMLTASPAPHPKPGITEMVDSAMVEMKNIYPPLKRSECERLIKAAIPWGMWGLDGRWHPNPNLEATSQEQHRQNIANGYSRADQYER